MRTQSKQTNMKTQFLKIGLIATVGLSTTTFTSCEKVDAQPDFGIENPKYIEFSDTTKNLDIVVMSEDFTTIAVEEPIMPQIPTFDDKKGDKFLQNEPIIVEDPIVVEPYVEPSAKMQGVKIGNTTWATSNVDSYGTFAANAYDAGKYYEWDSKTAWAGTDNSTTTPSDFPWSEANDPCPAGWRIPTLAEQQELLDKTSDKWTSNYQGSGVAGRIFTDGTNELFFPAVGSINAADGALSNADTNGFYWNSTQATGLYGYCLYFSKSSAGKAVFLRTYGRSIRCVAK